MGSFSFDIWEVSWEVPGRFLGGSGTDEVWEDALVVNWEVAWEEP